MGHDLVNDAVEVIDMLGEAMTILRTARADKQVTQADSDRVFRIIAEIEMEFPGLPQTWMKCREVAVVGELERMLKGRGFNFAGPDDEQPSVEHGLKNAWVLVIELAVRQVDDGTLPTPTSAHQVGHWRQWSEAWNQRPFVPAAPAKPTRTRSPRSKPAGGDATSIEVTERGDLRVGNVLVLRRHVRAALLREDAGQALGLEIVDRAVRRHVK